MASGADEELYNKENALMKRVYATIDGRVAQALSRVKSDDAIVKGGGYEEQDAFMAYGQLSASREKLHAENILARKVNDKPYFAHIEASYDDDDKDDFFLSDSETLEEIIMIKGGGMLLPFKLNKERPVSYALYRCYQDKNGEEVKYNAPGGELCIKPSLICDTDIKNRELLGVNQLFPMQENAQIIADELLAERLDENRDNPVLRNIIATLQANQFKIISADINQSFVVQGCAGSGKSQCLLHRLFFLRGNLSQEGWDKVLLLTPTKLFRQYSADLMRRYQLTGITDCSISDLYISLLTAYDRRFRDRHYDIQTTEEYLPDGYLKEAYSNDNISNIKREISGAIGNYVQIACNALEVDIPEVIDHEVIVKLLSQIDALLDEYKEKEESATKDKEYEQRKEQYDATNRELRKEERKYSNNAKSLEETENKITELENLISERDDLKREFKEWDKTRKDRLNDSSKRLHELETLVDKGEDIKAPYNYVTQLLIDRNMTKGEAAENDREETENWNELLQIADNDITKYTKGKSGTNELKSLKKKKHDLEKAMIGGQDKIKELTSAADEYSRWLDSVSNDSENDDVRKGKGPAELQHAKTVLTRLESTVFEQEVWKALAPKKEEYGIKTIIKEETTEGRQRETRILYKSDLLFYLMIYMSLYSKKSLPVYRYICIDEAQDLHRADFDILHELYPDSIFNVFGDTSQVLHTGCGISDWKNETGISELYELTTNYRNTADVVDFCNKKFSLDMSFIGKTGKGEEPITISSAQEIRTLVKDKSIILIVKDRMEYDKFCDEMGIGQDYYRFFDTNSEKSEEEHAECYTIYAAKGLEFTNVLVYARGMTKNQKVVACTRAMKGLYYYG